MSRLTNLCWGISLFTTLCFSSLSFADSFSERRKIIEWIWANKNYCFYDVRTGSKSRSKLIAHVGYYKRKVSLDGRNFELIYRRFFKENNGFVETLEIPISDKRKFIGFLYDNPAVYRLGSNDDGREIFLGLKNENVNEGDSEVYNNFVRELFNLTQE